MTDTRRLAGHAALLVALVATSVGVGQPLAVDEQAQDRRALITPVAQRSIDRGLEYLARRQHPNGAVGSGPYRENIAVTSLTGLAFLSSGSCPGEGPYGENLDRLVAFVLDSAELSGRLVVEEYTSHGPMYDHGFGTLFLAEIYGMTRRDDVREKLKKATELIIRTQNAEGGWRYLAQRTRDADLSVTICQIMALRAARNAGLDVPRSTVDKTVEYVRRSQNPDGGFRYMLTPGPSAFPRSAAGIVALYNAGIYEGPEIERGLEYLLRFTPDRQLRKESHYFYGHYYAVQAMYQAGNRYYDRWYPAIREELVARSLSDGSWPDGICPEYGTAMACIILQMPNGYLPIFQR